VREKDVNNNTAGDRLPRRKMRGSPIKRILVVDDEELYRALLQKFLTKKGYTCDISGSAAEALNMLQRQEFDVAISDIVMEGMDGLELMKRAKEEYPQLDFILMTGYAEKYTHSNIIDAGASDFIAKPFDLGELQAKLDRIGREKGMLRKLEETNKALQWEAEVNSSLAELSRALLTSVPMKAIGRLVLEDARVLTESPFACAAYIDRETGCVVSLSLTEEDVFESREGLDREEVLKGDKNFWGWVLVHKKSLVRNDILEEEDSSAGGPAQPRRFLSVPALAGEELIGQVAVADSERDYTERDQKLLERLGTIYALSMQRKWSEDQLRKAHDKLEELLNERSAKLARAGELLRKSMKSLEQIRTETDQT
jgi:CheY-like chemotaxis protein